MRRSMCVLTVLAMCACAAGAEWNEPKDNKLTEKQVTSYIAIMKDLVDLQKAAGKAVDNASGPAAMAILMRTNARYEEIIRKHGMTEPEMNWVAGKTLEAFGAAEMEAAIIGNRDNDLAKAGQEGAKSLADARARLAAHEAALKEGRRILSKEEREQIVADAKQEQKDAADEAKQHAKDAKEEQQAAAKAQDADEKKEALERAAEALKAEKEAQTRAAAAAKRIANPDLPATEEEKAEMVEEHKREIAQAKEEIKQLGEAAKLIQESGKASDDLLAEMRKNVPAENVALLKKHSKAFKQALGMEEEKKEQ